MRLAAGVAYDGTNYAGWQWQVNIPTLQSTLEHAISHVAKHPVRIISAGRTDQGVHASQQVIHFDTRCERTLDTWQRAINYHLPCDIRIVWIQVTDANFHARASAEHRTYRYIIYQGYLPWFRQYSWSIHRFLDVGAMQQASQPLIGEQDFSSFRAAQCQARSPTRRIRQLTIQQSNDCIELMINANAFLHHMVRNIVGVLVDIGKGKRAPDTMLALLRSRDRRNASITAPPQGLYLSGVTYPKRFNLPQQRLSDSL